MLRPDAGEVSLPRQQKSRFLVRILVLQDHKENRRKCSLTPLEGREGVTFVRLQSPALAPGKIEVGSGILLSIDSPQLSRADHGFVAGEGALVLLDSTWARLPKLANRLQLAQGARLERRSLPHGIVTAYPRVSKVHVDPLGGLASIEALYAATVILGEPRRELLDGYRWAEEFLRRNADLLLVTSPASRLC